MGKRTILLVENEPVIAVLTRMDLENLGYEVLSASTGVDAIRIAHEKHPAIVLMDFQLDGDLDGADAADEIQGRFQIPVIFLTGCSDLNKVQKCLSTKPVGFIRKPCRIEDLEQAIANAALRQSLLERFQHSERYPYHDEQTGLSNRRMLIENIRSALGTDSNFAILYIHIDRLKGINNSLGNPAGDRFLQLFAAKLEIFRRPGDQIARTGNDEFAILMHEVSNIEEANYYADFVHSLTKTPFLLNEKEIFTTLRIGIAYSKSAYQDPESMLNDAEMAMQQSREEAEDATRLLPSDSEKSFAA